MTASSSPDDLHRLIQEVISRLGYKTNAAAIARGVRRLNYGLPAEDEFSVICAWLGKCRLVHKLDQQQAPLTSRSEYQVPDLLAAFDGSGTFLIEVKACNDQTLSMKSDYYRRLRAYGELLDRPLLVVWKFYNLWTLVDVACLKLAKTNFNISHAEAMQQNLLGVLAGDVAYTLMPDAGVHFDLEKEELVAREATGDGWNEKWQMRIADAFLTDGSNQRRRDFHPETQQLLTTWPLKERAVHSETGILKSFVAGDGQVQFAHGALVRLLAWEGRDQQKPHWRGLLQAPQVTRSIASFSAALQRRLDEGVVRHIFHQHPTDRSVFLQSQCSAAAK